MEFPVVVVTVPDNFSSVTYVAHDIRGLAEVRAVSYLYMGRGRGFLIPDDFL